MAQFNIAHNAPNVTASGIRQKLSTSSWMRKDVKFIDPQGNEFIIPQGQNILQNLTQQALANQKALLHPISGNPLTGDYLEQYEKNFALKLKDQANFEAPIRDTDGRYGKEAQQWDGFVLSMTDDPALNEQENLAKYEAFKTIVIEELRSAEILRNKDVKNIGVDGKRAILISEDHDNTGHRHIHIMVNRFAFDMNRKEISKAVHFGQPGVVSEFLARVEARMAQEKLIAPNQTVSASSSISPNLTKNSLDRTAQEATQDILEETGIQFGTERVAEVPTAEGGTERKMVPLTVESQMLQEAAQAMANDIQNTQKEIARLQAAAQERAKSLQVIQQAQQALANEEALRQATLVAQQAEKTAKEALEAQQAALEQATQTNEALTTAKAALEEEKSQLDEAFTQTKQGLVTMGETLADMAPELDQETAALLRQGNLAVLNSIMEENAKTIATWGEALDQIPDDYASALREDPIDGLTNLLTKLETFEKDYNEAVLRNEELQTNNGLLLQERDGLLGERDGLLSKLDLQATQHEEALKAKDAAHALAVQELQSQLKEMQDALNAANTKAATLEGKLEGIHEMYEAQLAQRIKEIEATNQAKEAAEKALKVEQEKTSDLTAQIEKLTSQQKIFENLISGNLTDPKKFETERAKLDDATLASAITKLLEVENTKADLQEQLLAKTDAVDSLTKQLEAAQKNEAEAVETFAKANDDFAAQVSALNERITELTKEGKDAKGHVSDLTKQLKEAKEALEAAKKAAEAKAPAKEGKESKAPALDVQSKQILDFLANNADMKDLLLQAANNPNVAQELANLLNPGSAPAQDWTEGLDPTKDQDPGKNLDDDLDIK